jgi:ABC-2 type transport system permease protein
MWAIIERELRRFRRSPVLIVVSMVFPIVQLVVLGYAFGGNVKHLKLAIVDQDHGVPAIKIHELAGAVASGARTIDTIEYGDQGRALTDLRNGRVNGVLTIPPEFSRRVLAKNDPRVALIEDNTDNFVSATMASTMGLLVQSYNRPASAPRIATQPTLDVAEVYPPCRISSTAARLGRDVDLHDGDDWRRHHLHRRQGARPARGLSGHAHYQASS